MQYQLKDLLDVAELQDLLDHLDEAFGCPTAIVDREGTVLTASGWQALCTDFHRVHPQSAEECRQSDLYIFEHLGRGDESVVYTCPRGMTDCATPIVVDGRHLGNVFIGQFLLEEPDLDAFKEQARSFGYDQAAYLAALESVPVIGREEVELRLPFVRALAELAGEMGLRRLRDLEREQQLEEAQRIAHVGSWRIDHASGTTTVSDEAAALLGLEPDDASFDFSALLEAVCPEDRPAVVAAQQSAAASGEAATSRSASRGARTAPCGGSTCAGTTSETPREPRFLHSVPCTTSRRGARPRTRYER